MTHFNVFGFNFQCKGNKYANKICNAFQKIIRGELNGREPENEHVLDVLDTVSDLILIGEATTHPA